MSVQRTLALTVGLALVVAGSLVPAAAASAVPVTGIVGSVISNVMPTAVPSVVYVQDSGHMTVAQTQTNGSGQYEFSLPAGSYYLRFEPIASDPHAGEWHSDTPFMNEADLVPVTPGMVTTVNAYLDLGGTITGTVSASPAFAAGNIRVRVELEDAMHVFHDMGMERLPAANGSYTFSNLPAGNYRVHFEDTRSPAIYRDLYYNQKLTQGSGTTVAVAGGGIAANINAHLTRSGPIPTTHIAGADRYATSAAISAKFAPFAAGAGTVYLASGTNYPDALSAAPAAAHLGGPLLLTQPNVLPDVIAAELMRLHPQRVIIAGGPAAVSQAVANAVDALVPVVERVAGANRYETSKFITEGAFASATDVFFATGTNFPDALAASAAAAYLDGPVILVNGAGSDLGTSGMILYQLDTERVYIAGGTAVVSGEIEDVLGQTVGAENVTRFGGANRYDTAYLINSGIFAVGPIATAYLATGVGFADALSGAALAGRDGSPLYTTPATCVPSATLGDLGRLDVGQLGLFGGPSALGSGVDNLVAC